MNTLALADALFALLCGLLPVHGEHETRFERDARFAVIATAMAQASTWPSLEAMAGDGTPVPEARQLDTAAMLFTLGKFETMFGREAHAGRRGTGGGQGLWQLEPASKRKPPFVGLDFISTRHAAFEAAWLVRHSFACGGTPERRFAQLAFGHCKYEKTGWYASSRGPRRARRGIRAHPCAPAKGQWSMSTVEGFESLSELRERELSEPCIHCGAPAGERCRNSFTGVPQELRHHLVYSIGEIYATALERVELDAWVRL